MIDSVNPVTPAIVTQAVHPDVQIAAEEVRKTFGEFRSQWRNALERAVENGKAVTRLQAVCQSKGVDFTKELDRLGIPPSTAYANRDLAACWDKAQAMLKAADVEHEFQSAKELLEFVKGPKESKPKGKKKESDTTAVGTVAEVTNAVVTAGATSGTTITEPTVSAKEPQEADLGGESQVAVLTERFVAAMGDRMDAPVRVKSGGKVRIGNHSIAVTKPVLLLPE
jgi:hypothetical protein